MSRYKFGINSNASRCIALSSCLAVLPLSAQADSFDAGAVMKKMGTEERYAFVAGVVEGLAVSRFMQDAKKPDGMNCIYDWFYKDAKTVQNIYAAFERYPGYPPGTVIDALARKTCS